MISRLVYFLRVCPILVFNVILALLLYCLFYMGNNDRLASTVISGKTPSDFKLQQSLA